MDFMVGTKVTVETFTGQTFTGWITDTDGDVTAIETQEGVKTFWNSEAKSVQPAKVGW